MGDLCIYTVADTATGAAHTGFGIWAGGVIVSGADAVLKTDGTQGDVGILGRIAGVLRDLQ